MINKFYVWQPIYSPIGEPRLPLSEIYNPLYPCHLKRGCKASRKKIKK